jgi:WD40 repeat protein
MSGDPSEERQEPLASWLASCDNALAAGNPLPAADAAGVTPEAQARRQRGLDLLRLLRQALPPQPSPPTAADSEARTLPPKPAGEEPGPLPQVAGYEILEELGRGGMGVVYKARHVQLDRLVALKMILAGDHAGAQARARFRTEAEAVARLQHANVVQIHDIGEHQGLPYFSLEFCPGGSLAARLDGTPLPPGPAAALAETLAGAVHAAHQAGVVHRDLKPANVLLAADGTPKISDFGLAKRLDGAGGPTRSGAILGTPSYMAPEQAGTTAASAGVVAVGGEVGPAADVYALGAILYELLTGRPPFRGSSPMNTVLQLLTYEPVPPHLLVPKVPRDLETIALKCLQKDPRRRYASAEELAEDLRRFQENKPIRARPVGPAGRAWRWARRRPAAAGLLGLAVVTLAAMVALAVGLVYGVQLDAQRKTAQKARDDAVEARDALAQAKEQVEQQKGQIEEQKGEVEKQKGEVEKQRDLVRRTSYAARTNLAADAWRDGEITRMLLLLNEQRPEQTGGDDLRGWEWYYLWHLAHADLCTFRGHRNVVHAIAFSPDGTHLASTSQGIKVWDARTGQEVWTLTVGTATVLGVSWSPDGMRLAGASDDKTVKVLDASTGQEALTLKGHTDAVWGVSWSPDGTRLASASKDQTVRVWSLQTGQELLTLQGHTREVSRVAWSPDGTRLASASNDATVKVWDAQTGKEVRTLHGRVAFTGVAWSPDGTRLASAAFDRALTVWDLETGRVVRAFQGHTDFATVVAWSPDGTRLATGSLDQTVKLWDAQSGQEVRTFKGHTQGVNSVAWSPDGTRLASASSDETARVWDARADPEAHILQGRTGTIFCVAWSPDGARLASGDGAGTVKLWDARTDREAQTLQGHTGNVWAVAFSPDGTRLASAGTDKTVKVWDLPTGRVTLTLEGHAASAQGVAFSPDGTRLASTSVDRTVKLWDARTGREVRTLGGDGQLVTAVAWSPDGTRLASSSLDGTKVWDLLTGQPVLSLNSMRMARVAFSPDGKRLVVNCQYDSIKVWDLLTGQEVRTLRQSGGCFMMALSPDGKRLATTARGTVKVWDLLTGEEVLTLRGLTEPVCAVAWSADGTRLASASAGERTVRVWDAPPESSLTPAGPP